MNTIKIFLSTDGSVATLEMGFPLYQGSFQNKLLNTYIPKSILPPQFSSEPIDGVAALSSTFSTAVKIGVTSIARNGAIVTSTPRYLRYLKDVVINNVEYALYERMLPKEVTAYAGVGTQAPLLNITVVEINDIDQEVTSIIPSQQVRIDVLPSSDLNTGEEVIEPSELDSINGQLGDINADLNKKTTEINNLETQQDTNTQDIESNATQIAEIAQRVTELESQTVTGFTYVGEYPTQQELPTDEQLTQFVVSKLSRQPQAGDFIRFTQDIPDGTDLSYTYYYSAGSWGDPVPIPVTEKADNATYGLIKGTRNDTTGTTQVDVVQGEIEGIYTKNTQGLFVNVATRLNTLDTTQGNIITGSQIVGSSKKANTDKNGNDITTYYAPLEGTATEQYVKDNFAPITYTKKYYISNRGYLDNPPNLAADNNPQFTVTTNQVGEFQLFTLTRTLTANYNFTSENGSTTKVWVTSNVDVNYDFKLVTEVKKATDTDWTTLNTELTGETQLGADTLKLITFSDNFSDLNENEIELNEGDFYRQTLYVVSTSSTSVTFELYSNVAYPSSFILNSNTANVYINTIGDYKPVTISASDFVQSGDTYQAVITPLVHQQPVKSWYFLSFAYNQGGGLRRKVLTDVAVSSGGNITVYADEPIDVTMYIASSLDSNIPRSVLTLTNPTTIPPIEYLTVGAIKIVQTEQAVDLTLPTPSNSGAFYKIFVTNSSSSTFPITVNDIVIDVNESVYFAWTGSWEISDVPEKTSEITDDLNNQPLNTTLGDLQTGIDNNATAIQDLTTLVEKETNIVGSVLFNQNGTTPIQTITSPVSGTLVPLNLATADIDVSNAPETADGTVQSSWLGTPYQSGATPSNLVFFSSSMPVAANATGSTILINPIVGQTTRVELTLSYTKATNTQLTMGLVVLNTATGEVVRGTQFPTITGATTGSIVFPQLFLQYKTGDQYVVFIQPTYSGGSVTNISLNRVKLTTDYYPLKKEL